MVKTTNNDEDGIFSKSRYKQYITCILAINPFFVYGTQLGWMSPAIPQLQENGTLTNSPLSNDEISWMASGLGAGAIFGVLLFAFLAEIWGRKRAIIALAVPQFICWLLKIVTLSPPFLIVARMMAGLSTGGALTLIPLYIKEISDPECRGALNTLCIFFIKTGTLFVYMTGAYFMYYTNLYILILFPICHILMFTTCPESPAYLLHVGKREECIKTIAGLRNWRKRDERVLELYQILELENKQLDESRKLTIATMFRDQCTFKAFIICTLLHCTQVFSGIPVILTYASTIFKQAGGETSPHIQAIFMGMTQLIGCFVATTFVEKCGRRPLLISSCAIMSCCLATMGIWFLLTDLSVTTPTWIPVVVTCTTIFSNSVGAAPMSIVIKAEIFNYRVRTTMAGLAVITSFVSLVIIVRIFTPISVYLGIYTVFFLYSLLTAVVGLYFYIFVPETKGRCLEAIQKRLLYGRKYEDDFSDEDKVLNAPDVK